MATRFVAATGGNDAGPGTEAAPYATFSRANANVTEGDEVIALAGTYSNLYPGTNVVLKPKTGITYTGRPGAKLDTGVVGTEIIRATDGIRDFTIQGFEIVGGGIVINRCYRFYIKTNLIHKVNGNGIYVGHSDLIWIEGNEVYNASIDGGEFGVQGISILQSDAVAEPTPDGWGGYRTIVRGNVSHSNIPTGGPKSDACGWIIDRNNTPPNWDYRGPTLVEGNLTYNNGGPGGRVMYSRDVHVRYNTSFGNMKDERGDRGWACDFHETQSQGNKWEYNVALVTDTLNSYYAFRNTNARELGAVETTYFHNVFCGINGRDALASNNGQTTYKGPAPSPTDNKLGVDPKFKSLIDNKFELEIDSPAIGYGESGKNAGWWQSAVEPETIERLSDGLLVLGGIYSGDTFTFTAPVYSGTVTLTFTPQYYNGGWAPIEAPLTDVGGGDYTGANPSVPGKGGFRIKTLAVGDNFSETTFTNWEDIFPPVVDPDTLPVNTVAPTIVGTGAVGSTLTVTTGTWSGKPTPEFVVQWTRDGVDITDATALSYTPVLADDGALIRVRVDGTNSVGTVSVVTDPIGPIVSTVPDDDLTGLTNRVGNLEAGQEAIQSNVSSVVSRLDASDAAIESSQALMLTRIANAEGRANESAEKVATLDETVAAISSGQNNVSQDIATLYSLINQEGAGGTIAMPKHTSNVLVESSDWVLIHAGDGNEVQFELLGNRAGSYVYASETPGNVFGHRLMPYRSIPVTLAEGTNIYYRGGDRDILVVSSSGG